MDFHIGYPQATFVILLLLSNGISMAKHGQPRGNYDAVSALIGTALSLSLLYWGGFFG